MRVVALVVLVLMVASASALSGSKVRRLQRSCSGDCLDVTRHKCKYGFQSGMCPGGANIQCCQPPRTGSGSPSEAGVGSPCPDGVCQLTSSSCAGTFVAGLCPGGANVQCCQKRSNGQAQVTPSTPAVRPPSANAGAISIPASFNAIWKAYPNGEAEEVKRHLGGAVDADWITNTCVIRVTRALAMAGAKIGKFNLANGNEMVRIKDGLGNRLAIRVAEFKQYMVGTFGKPQVKVASATDGMDIPEQLKGKRGIIMFDVRVWSDATGHVDLWNGESCAHDCYFNKAREVWLWVVA